MSTKGVKSIPYLSFRFNHAKECNAPILLRNPDGSIAEGLPPGYCEPTPPLTPRDIPGGAAFHDNDGSDLQEDLEYLYTRHEQLFMALILFQLSVEILFNVFYVTRSEYALMELRMVYNNVATSALTRLFWAMFAIELAYSVTYYGVAAWCLFRHSTRRYDLFATVCLVGVVIQVFMTYVNKFNLLLELRECSR